MIADSAHRLPPPPGMDPAHPARALPAPDQQQANQKKPKRPKTRTLVWIVVGILLLFLILLVLGIIIRIHRRHTLAADANKQQNDPPKVVIIHATRPKEADLSLAANTQAIQDAIIYARTSGYLTKRYADLGDRVKAGQLLAEIQSPEIDQQLRQAEADLKQSFKNLDQQKANLEFARVTVERFKAADKENAVAKEDLDQRISAYQTALAAVAAAEANIGSNEANVARYRELTSFERITAPFDGTVIQRNIDVGSLVTSGSPTNNTTLAPTSLGGGANGLFEIAQLDTLRVFVNVPQVYAPNVVLGMDASVTVRGQLKHPTWARVTRSAEALDPSTRTLLTEVDIPNAEHQLMPGMFVYVGFKIGPSGSRWHVPDTAVIFDEHGTQVWVVDSDRKLAVKTVVVGRDFGNAIDIQSGITDDDSILKQPTVALQEGQKVEPVEEKESKKKGSQEKK